MTRLVMCSFFYYYLFKPYYFQSGTGTVTHFCHTTDDQESAGILFLPHYGLPARHWYRHRIESVEDRLDKCSWTSFLVMIISIVVTMNCINLFFVSLCKSSLVSECRFLPFYFTPNLSETDFMWSTDYEAMKPCLPMSSISMPATYCTVQISWTSTMSFKLNLLVCGNKKDRFFLILSLYYEMS